MSREVIYEKHYPKPTTAGNCNGVFDHEVSEKPEMSFDQIMDEIYRDVVYVLVPWKQKRAKQFVAKAIKISSTYEMNVKIVRHDSHISVNYYFDCAGCMGFLKDVLVYADDISFFTNINGYEILLSIDYYTHDVYRKGRKVMP